MTIRPRVSVIMSVYNDEKNLRSSIESILKQSFKDFEFIIIDDGSTDGSSKIVDEYAKKDSRIVALHQKNSGLTISLNRMIEASKGDFILRQDSDDYSAPERFSEQISFLEKHPDVMLLGTGAYIIDADGEVLLQTKVLSGSAAIRRAMISGNRFIHGSTAIRKECLTDVGVYYKECVYSEDYDLFLRISERYDTDNLPGALYFYRINLNSLSFTKTETQIRESMIIRSGAKLRRKGLMSKWNSEIHAALEKKLNTLCMRRVVRSKVCFYRGGVYLINREYKKALKEFFKSNISFPTPRAVAYLFLAFIKCFKMPSL
jgi:O-antigen biosynthesis protein